MVPARTLATAYEESAKSDMAWWYNRTAHARNYQLGDLVLVLFLTYSSSFWSNGKVPTPLLLKSLTLSTRYGWMIDENLSIGIMSIT